MAETLNERLARELETVRGHLTGAIDDAKAGERGCALATAQIAFDTLKSVLYNARHGMR